jgi:hypothetical protein
MSQWTPEQRLTFDLEMALKKSKRIKRVTRDEDPFPALARHIAGQLRLCGWRFTHDEAPRPVALDAYRAVAEDARAALRMIREEVELHAPPGAVVSEEDVEPPLVAEAAALIGGIRAIAERGAS